MIVPSFADTKIATEQGYLTPQWNAVLSILLSQAEQSLSEEGFLIPSQPESNFLQIETAAKLGTLLFDSTNDELTVRLADGTFHPLQIGGEAVLIIDGTDGDISATRVGQTVTIDLVNTSVTAGNYDYPTQVNVDEKGRVTFISSGIEPLQSISGTLNQVSITAGVNPVVSLSDNLIIPGHEGFIPPVGTTAQRPVSPVLGQIRVNSDLGYLETWIGVSWEPINTSAGTVIGVFGTSGQIVVTPSSPNPVVSIATNPTIPGNATITGSLTLQGNLNFNADNTYFIGQDSARVARYYGVNFVDDGTNCAIDGGLYVGSFISLASLSASQLVLSDSQKKLVSTSVLNESLGGTGETVYTNGQLLIGDTVSGGLVKANLTAGAGVSILNSGGGITISATGSGGTVTSLTAGTGITLTPSTITGTGTIALASPVSLANGGTNASLTASNGGIAWSNGTQLQVLAGTSTARQLLLSGATASPAWSTVTFPATTTINQLLYSSSANTIAGLATANSGVLVTSSGGVPSISSTLPSGLTIPGYQATITPAALTRVNDTNVTLTLGGVPATSLLQAVSITAGWTGLLSPARGGTGVNNGSSTITLGGNLITSGAFSSTFTITGTTAVTFPTSGTLATTTGTVTNATNAANVAITNDNSTNATMYPLWATANTGNIPLKTSSSLLTWNPSTGTFSAPIISCSSASLSQTTPLTINNPLTGGVIFNIFSGPATASISLAGSVAPLTFGIGGAATGFSFAGNTTIQTGFNLTLANLSTAGIVRNNSSGLLSSIATVSVALGGTGQSSYTNGQLLIGNTTGNTLTPATLTAGTAIGITNGTGSITIANTGVTSITGTTNQVIASSSTGAITLSLPQSIATSSSPTFAGLTCSGTILTTNLYNSNSGTGSLSVAGASGGAFTGTLTMWGGNSATAANNNAILGGAWSGSTNGGALTLGGGFSATSSNNTLNFGSSSAVQTINCYGSIVPGSNNTYNLGSSGNKWSNIYSANTVYGNLIWAGGYTGPQNTNTVIQTPNAVFYQGLCFSWNTYSHSKFKKDIQDVNPEDDLKKVLLLRRKSWCWEKGCGDNFPGMKPLVHHGFVTEEIHCIHPTATNDAYNVENAIGIDYSKLSALYAGALQAIYSRIEKIQEFINMKKDIEENNYGN